MARFKYTYLALSTPISAKTSDVLTLVEYRPFVFFYPTTLVLFQYTLPIMYLSGILLGVLFSQKSIAAAFPQLQTSDVIVPRSNSSIEGFESKGLPKCSHHTHGTCKWHNHGNMDIGFEDKIMNWGTRSPEAVIDHIHKQCPRASGLCKGGTAKFSTTILRHSGGDPHAADVECKYTGSFKPKHKNNLVKALKGAVGKTLKKHHIVGGNSVTRWPFH
jgi:hypothetical protein